MSGKKKVPAIRFQGFSGEWEENKIKNIAPLQRGFDLPKNDMKVGSYPVVMSSGISCYHSCYKVKGPGIVTGRSGTIGKVHYVAIDYWPHNTALWVTGFNGNFPLYIYYLYIKLDLNRFGTGSGVPTLNRNDVHDQYTIIPKDKKEQAKIGNFFQKLDSLISQQQKKHEKLQNLKKALLQKMFPQQGQSVPELRFQGFCGEWEEKILGEIGSFYSGWGFPEKEQKGETGVPYFKVSDMNLNGNQQKMMFANNYVNKEQIARLNYKPIYEKSIIFAKVGAAIFLERKRIASDFLIDNNMMAYSPTENVIFIKLWFDNIKLSEYVQIGALPSYNASSLKEIELYIPKNEEQTKIGNFFQQLDKFINQQQAQLEKLKNIKKACLEKMFV